MTSNQESELLKVTCPCEVGPPCNHNCPCGHRAMSGTCKVVGCPGMASIHRHTLEQSLTQERQQHSETMNALRNLLAVIHRDGGHYFTEHGMDKAVEDARQAVLDERQQKEAADDRANRAVRVQQEAVAELTTRLEAAREALEITMAGRCSDCDVDTVCCSAAVMAARAALSEPQQTADVEVKG